MAKRQKSTRKNIRYDMQVREVIDVLADGNIGAQNVLLGFLNRDVAGMAVAMPFFNIDDLNLRGDQIWEAFKFAIGDLEDDAALEAFAAALKKSDPAMIAHVNRVCIRPSGEQAFSGASYARR